MGFLECEYDYEMDIAVQVEEARQQALEQGIKKGIEQGIEKGIEQGAYQNKLETAKAFKAMGIPLAQIAKGTGLSIEEIEKL